MRSPPQHLVLPTPPIPHLNVQVPPANHVAVDFLDGGEGETAEDDWGARGETGFEGLEGGGEVVGTHEEEVVVEERIGVVVLCGVILVLFL